MNIALKNLANTRKGSLLIEAMIAIVVFGIFVSAAYTTLLTGQESTRNGSNRIRGVHYTEQGLEAMRSIRNQSFSTLTDGEHGYDLDSDTFTWTLTGSSLSRYDYTSSITVHSLSPTRKQIDSESNWEFGYMRAGRTFLTTIISSWRTKVGVGNWLSMTQTGSWTAGKQIDINDLYAYKGYLYATANGTSFGSGIVILDVDPPTTPTRVASTFNIAANVYTPIAYYNRLYVAVNASPTIRAFDITTPTSLNASTTPIASADLPGAVGRARSLAINDKTLLVGATGVSGQDELYAYNITTGSTLTLVDSLNLSGDPTVNDIYVFNNIAYVGTSNTKMYVVDVSDPSNINLLTTVDMGFQAITGVRMYGTGFFATMSNGLAEFSMRTGTGSGLPSTALSDRYSIDLGAGANSLDMDSLGCYNFLATDNSSKELQVRSGTSTSLTELSSQNTATGNGRTVHYDQTQDRLYFGTQSGIYIYTPGAVTTCI